MTRIINFFGAPGSGKTTAAAEAFVRIKKKGYSAHLVQEYATELIMQGKAEQVKDQKKLFEEQLRRIGIANDKVDFIVVDSPLLLNVVYDRYRKGSSNNSFEKNVVDAHKNFEQTNILLKYDSKNYTSKGRVTTSQESFVIEQKIKDVLKETKTPFVEISSFDELENNFNSIIEKGVKK
ncbi:MAG: AAA family ATPase [Alphaproteobacteria bacterium]|nr:AAA family ATPase [Alphaproteobacteria bacterium]